MKILILEDDENRLNKFRQLFIGCELLVTKDPYEANKWVEEHNDFDAIFLDHDLTLEHYTTWEKPEVVYEDTGLNTAKFLGENSDLCINATVFVHTLNPHGRKNMVEALRSRKVEVVPFTVLAERLIINR